MYFKVTLFLTDDLFSKFGFFDGDILDGLIRENFSEILKEQQIEIDHNLPYKECRALNFPDDLLEIIVRKYILPKIPHKITLQRWVGHNPVRAKLIDGKEIHFDNAVNANVEPKYIEIENEKIIEEGRKLWQNSEYLDEVRHQFPNP